MTSSNTTDPLGFGKFVPGFDFLQGLSKGAAQAGSASNPAGAAFNQWFTPTMSEEDLDKRIGELKTVQFWLEQNTRALAATIQALEVQKMTLATLKSMNFPMPSAFGGMATSQDAAPTGKANTDAESHPAAESKTAGPAVDPMQLWGALTKQFQNIATSALKDVGNAASQAVSTSATVAKKTSTAAAKPRTAARPAAKKATAARARKRP